MGAGTLGEMWRRGGERRGWEWRRQWGAANEMGLEDLVTLDFGVKDSSEHGFGHVEMRLRH